MTTRRCGGFEEMSDEEDGNDGGSAGGRPEGQRASRRHPNASREPGSQRCPWEEGRGPMNDEEDEEHLSGMPGRRSTSPVSGSVSSNTAFWMQAMVCGVIVELMIYSQLSL
jgi:hypothetical protein